MFQLLFCEEPLWVKAKWSFQVNSTKIERVSFNWSVRKRPSNPVWIICLYPRYKGHSLELPWPTSLFVIKQKDCSVCVPLWINQSLQRSWPSLLSSWRIQAHTGIISPPPKFCVLSLVLQSLFLIFIVFFFGLLGSNSNIYILY